MEGLHFRKKEGSRNAEEETEFLDEEGIFFLCFKKNKRLSSKIISTEQEKLLQELREQNDTANLNIQVMMNIYNYVSSFHSTF